jgi:hypothetical protein
MSKEIKPKVETPKVETNIPVGPSQPEFIPWIKATQEQRIDRLHFVLKDIIKAMNAVQKKADKIESRLFNHKHIDNQIMQIMNQFEPAEKEMPDNRPAEEIWF